MFGIRSLWTVRMASHNYTPELALDILLAKLRSKDPLLVAVVQAAIDTGKDVEERETTSDARRRPRLFRRTVRFSQEEALGVAVHVLRAYFVEEPMFRASALADLKEAAIGTSAQLTVSPAGLVEENLELIYRGEAKNAEIELQTETQ